MSPYRGGASLEERVSWTTGFTKPADKVVLGALAFFADFESGRNARPGMHRLVARADLAKRTVERSLQRLIAEGWITVTSRRHLGYTTYAIATERLAVSRAAARVVGARAAPLSANLADKASDPLSAKLAGLSANLAGAVRQPGGRTSDQVPEISTQVHRTRDERAPATAPTETATANAGAVFARGDYGLAATEGADLAARGGDVCANGDDRAARDGDRPDARPDEPLRPDRALASGAGVSVRDGDDSPRDRGADARPLQQPSFLPPCVGVANVGDVVDDFAPIVLADDRPRDSRRPLVTLGEMWRANLEARRKARAVSS
jgi:hypothetical protein